MIGLGYVQVILARRSGVLVTIAIPLRDGIDDHDRVLSDLAAQVTELIDVSSTDEIGLASPGQPDAGSH